MLILTRFLVTEAYINLSLFLAFAKVAPNFILNILFAIRVKIKHLAMLNLAIIVYNFIVANSFGMRLLIITPLINYLVFFVKDSFKTTVNYSKNRKIRKDFNMNKDLIKVSIRNLVEFVLRKGSIDSRVKASVRAQEGIKGHKKIQESYGGGGKSEVFLKEEIKFENFILKIEGRADGILYNDDEFTIDEIKTTTKDVMGIDESFNELHWAQAKIYAYIFSKERELEFINVQLTYYNIEDYKVKYLRKKYSFIELERFFFKIINSYKEWIDREKTWKEKRNKSIKELTFPFNEYRKGQRELAVRVYKSIEEGKRCFAQAPTGTGKTISTLFPSVKALGMDETSKIFYLTAKTTTREIVSNTIKILRENGAKLRSVVLTAKDKCCKMEEKKCIPEYCPYANGYFDRVNMALEEAFKNEGEYNLEYINYIGDKFNICPFEFSLELTSWCDIVICDYNYIFDPQVSLKGSLDCRTKDYTLLIDEAHNLLERGRSMYSAFLQKDGILDLKREFKSKDKAIYKSLDKINKYFIEKRKLLESLDVKTLIEKEESKEIYGVLRGLIEVIDIYQSNIKEENEKLLNVYFDVYSFLNVSNYYSKEFVSLYKTDGNNISLEINCLDPSKILSEIMAEFKSIIIFSATLLPIEYFKSIYGYKEGDFLINLHSPFDEKNKLTIVGANASTTYRNRRNSLPKIVKYIKEFISGKKGNYLVFFPSYEYMNMVYDEFLKEKNDFTIKLQAFNMTDEQKENYIALFNKEKENSHVGFAVLGGHFSEGIDLTLDKLIGVIIVGVGMPKICPEREALKEYYEKLGLNGFDYAYVYPGIIKVLQGAGRCIRTENDKGIILLLDDRYFTNKYKELLPSDWYKNIMVSRDIDIREHCIDFWNNQL